MRFKILCFRLKLTLRSEFRGSSRAASVHYRCTRQTLDESSPNFWIPFVTKGLEEFEELSQFLIFGHCKIFILYRHSNITYLNLPGDLKLTCYCNVKRARRRPVTSASLQTFLDLLRVELQMPNNFKCPSEAKFIYIHNPVSESSRLCLK